MSKNHKLAALTILLALAINPAFAEEKAAAVVNGTAIPQSLIDGFTADEVARGQADTPELRKTILDKMINLELVSKEAEKQGLDKDADLQKQFVQIKKELLANAFVKNYLATHPVTEAQTKAEYDKIKSKFGDKEYSVSHILVKTEAEAKDIIAKLEKKGKFEQLASKSIDAGSGKAGGSLGWTVPSNLVKPFADEMLNLKKGEYTKAPVQSQFGWHVIKLNDIRPLKVPTVDELKPQLQRSLQQQAIQKVIADIRASAKID